MNTESELLIKLDALISNWEDETVEFNDANNDYDKDKIGRYFSALSNEANLRNVQCGWLIFGIKEKGKKIMGTNYREKKGLDTLKHEISLQTTGGISFVEIYEVKKEGKRIIMFQIPAATAGIPTGWKDQYYAREGDSLVPLSLEKMDRIRQQSNRDWSKLFVKGATIQHLNKDAISLARNNYKEKMQKPHISQEIDSMSDEEFLTKMKLIQNGRITNACMLLLGNEDYDYLFDYTPEAAWRLYDSKSNIKDYEIFKIPFITLSDRILKKTGTHQNAGDLVYRNLPGYLARLKAENFEKIDLVLTDGQDLYQEICAYLPHLVEEKKVQLYRDDAVSLSTLYHLRGNMQELLSSKVWLDSGANIIIESLETLTVIDVNSGKNRSRREEALFAINVEAAKEIARQLRLRNISGMILVDFINLKKKEQQQKLISVIREELQKDSVPANFIDITRLGLVELTRKKVYKSLREILS